MSKKNWSSINFVVSVVVIVGAFWAFSSSHQAAPVPAPGQNSTAVPAGPPPESGGLKQGGLNSKIETLGSAPVEVIQSQPPAANSPAPSAGSAVDLSAEMAAQLKAPPPELPDDLKRQLEGPPPELPDDLKAQLNAPPPPIPEDIKRALATPPRVVSIEEVNGPNSGAQ